MGRHDFITYFETNDIRAFEELLRRLQGLGQFKYFAFPQAVYIGAPQSIQETLSHLLGRAAEILEFPGGVTVVPGSPREGKHMTVRYDGLLSRSGAREVFLHLGHGAPGAWQNVCESRMVDTLNRGWERAFAIDAPPPVHFCFRDAAGNWDNNHGRNWTCPPEAWAGD